MRRFLLVVCLPLFLTACGTAEPVWAPDEAVSRATYRHGAPTSLTLVTMYNNRSNEGAHSALLVNGSERVLFDPAGSWYHRAAPERNDVHFGMTPTMWKFYIDYHARETYRAEIQTVEVSPEVAERALQLVKAYGAVPKAHCANATSSILSQLPGFETVTRGFYPGKISQKFALVPGVSTQVVFDDDGDDNASVLATQNRLQVDEWAATQAIR